MAGEQLHANLSLWNAKRQEWHKQSKCGSSCACSDSEGWFHSISRSEQQLQEGLLCKPVACPELCIETDKGETPKLYKPECTCGECDGPSCLQARLEQLRACKTEFAKSTGLVRYRKYLKMDRVRNDGTPYTETEFVYVMEPDEQFASSMLSFVEAYLPHRQEHSWGTRSRNVAKQKLKYAPALETIVEEDERGGDEGSGEGGEGSREGGEAELIKRMVQWISERLDPNHPEHLTFTSHDIMIWTDFAARVCTRAQGLLPPPVRPYSPACSYNQANSSLLLSHTPGRSSTRMPPPQRASIRSRGRCVSPSCCTPPPSDW